MMPPPFAKRLIARRMAGTHPRIVYCIFSYDAIVRATRRLTERPALDVIAIPAGTYESGAYDFRCVTGTEVFLDCYARLGRPDAERWREYEIQRWRWLGAELLEAGARGVMWRFNEPVYAGDIAPRMEFESLRALEACYRLRDGAFCSTWTSARELEPEAA